MEDLLKKLYNCTHSQLLFMYLGSLNSSYFLCEVELGVVCCSELICFLNGKPKLDGEGRFLKMLFPKACCSYCPGTKQLRLCQIRYFPKEIAFR